MPLRPVTFRPHRVKQSPLAKVGGRDRPTTTERGYDAVWERVRARFLLDNPLCLQCRPRHVPATEVDHIATIRKRPDLRLDPGNLQALCKSHHSRKTRAEQLAVARQIAVRPA